MNIKSIGFWLGIAMTAVLSIIGKELATLPFLSIIGQMVIAILLGMLWTTVAGNKMARHKPIHAGLVSGQNFAAKILLRAGIIVLGVRLDLVALEHAGIRVLGTEMVLVALTMLIGYWIARKMKVEPTLAMIAVAGTAICGAAAACAIAVQVRAKSEYTVIGVATISLIGTLFTIVDTLLYPFLGLSPQAFGIYTGASLHEIAHVIAAASPFGVTALDNAVLVKLSRVVLLAPVAMVVGAWFNRRERLQDLTLRQTQAATAAEEIAATSTSPQTQQKRSLPIPWFVLGFLAVGALHTWNWIPSTWTPFLIQASLFLLTMGMAGLGLQVNIRALRGSQRVFSATLITSVLLAIVTWFVAKTFLI